MASARRSTSSGVLYRAKLARAEAVDPEPIVQRHDAMVAGPDGDPGAVEQLGEVVGMDPVDGEAEDPPLVSGAGPSRWTPGMPESRRWACSVSRRSWSIRAGRSSAAR